MQDGATCEVTRIQRFGSALNLNIHFHILLLDSIYVYRDNRPPRFQRITQRILAKTATLDLHLFSSLSEVRDLTTEWMRIYNDQRAHAALGDMTPVTYMVAAKQAENASTAWT